MIKHYLVPAEGDGQTPATAFRAKYLKDLKINCSAVHLPEKGMFLVVANTRDADKIASLESNNDVISLDTNSKSIRTKLKSSLGVDYVAGDDLTSKIGKLVESNFNKENFSVSSD